MIAISSMRFRRLSSCSLLSRPLGFVGLGTMGTPMALNLLRRSSAGLVVWDRQPGAAGTKVLVEAGAREATSLAAVGAQCDCIVLCLPGGAEVEDALFSPSGLAAAIKPSGLIIDCSTTTPQTSELAAARLDCRFVDAPVTGERARAEDATLTIMVGGSAADAEAASPVLQSMSRLVVHVGSHGHGQLAKALNNCLTTSPWLRWPKRSPSRPNWSSTSRRSVVSCRQDLARGAPLARHTPVT